MYELEVIHRKQNGAIPRVVFRVYKDEMELDNVLSVDSTDNETEPMVRLTLSDGISFPVRIDNVRHTYE